MEWYLIGLLIFTFILFEVFLRYKRRRHFSEHDRAFAKKQWENITDQVSTQPKHAVLEADKLLDEMLKKRGYKGSLGEKLKQAGAIFSDINGVWQAHKLRNRIAHELGFEVSRKTAEHTLKIFEKAFRDLRIF